MNYSRIQSYSVHEIRGWLEFPPYVIYRMLNVMTLILDSLPNWTNTYSSSVRSNRNNCCLNWTHVTLALSVFWSNFKWWLLRRNQLRQQIDPLKFQEEVHPYLSKVTTALNALNYTNLNTLVWFHTYFGVSTKWFNFILPCKKLYDCGVKTKFKPVTKYTNQLIYISLYIRYVMLQSSYGL